MALYGLLSDLHLTRKPPSSCTETYLEDLLDLIEQAFAACRDRQARALAIAGDTFHHKAPTRTDHGLVRTLTRMFRTAGVPVLAVGGNHDFQNDRHASLDRQPLGVLFESGALAELDGWAGDLPLFGVPWQQHWTDEGLGAVLAPWREQVFERGTGTRHVLAVAHAPLYPPGQQPRYDGAEFVEPVTWSRAMGGAGFCFYGHIHEPHGAWHCNGVSYCNNGALSRGSLDEHNLSREVGVTFWDDADGQFEFVPLDARPAGQVFRLREHDQAVTSHGKLAGFLADVSGSVLPVLTEATVMEHVRQQSPGRPAEDLSEELLAWAQHEGKPK